jgi:hypothetical protein
MFQPTQKLVTALWSGLLAATLSATAVAQPAPAKPASPAIQGEPIDAPKPTPTPAPATTGATSQTPAVKAASTPDPKPAVAPAPVPSSSTDPAYAFQQTGGYLIVGFDKLASYEFSAPDTQVTNTPPTGDVGDKYIPARIKWLDGKKVIIKGFLLPLKVEAEKATEFLILRNQSACCYGVPPKITEFLSVTVKGAGVEPTMDQPVNVKGTLHVGTMRENGYIVGVYSLDGEKLIDD